MDRWGGVAGGRGGTGEIPNPVTAGQMEQNGSQSGGGVGASSESLCPSSEASTTASHTPATQRIVRPSPVAPNTAHLKTPISVE